MKVWIDQDLCTGDGLCEEIAPDVFTLLDDGLAYVKEGDKVFATAKGNPQGAEGMADIPDGQLDAVIEIRRGVPRRVHLHRAVTARLTERPRAPAAAASAAEERGRTVRKPVWATMRWSGRTAWPSMCQPRCSTSSVRASIHAALAAPRGPAPPG